MSSFHKPKIRIGDVERAIRSPGKVLRNWINLKQVTLWGASSGKWREFSQAELLHLALVRALVNHGVPVEVADGLSLDTLSAHFSMFNGDEDALERVLVKFRSLLLFLIFKQPDETDFGGWQLFEMQAGGTIRLDGDAGFVVLVPGDIFADALFRAYHEGDLPIGLTVQRRSFEVREVL